MILSLTCFSYILYVKTKKRGTLKTRNPLIKESSFLKRSCFEHRFKIIIFENLSNKKMNNQIQIIENEIMNQIIETIEMREGEIPASSFYRIGAYLASGGFCDSSDEEEEEDGELQTKSAECYVCDSKVPAGGRLYAGGEHSDYCMCKSCWERPQCSCVNSCYVEEGETLCAWCKHKESKVWLMTPDNKNVQSVKYNFKLASKFPNGFECRQFCIDDIMDYYVVFFDNDNSGAYNASAKWVAPSCEVSPTGNFIVMRKKWINGTEHTVEMDISPKDFKKKYLR